jgi:twinkle protein
VSFYGVVVNEREHLYPYFTGDSTTPCGFKVRRLDQKGFRSVGDVRDAGLFGQQKYGNHDRKRVVITEGEADALAARQLLGGKVSVVSLKGGAGAAAKDAKGSFEFLDGFQEIICCMDADEAGREATEKLAEVFAGKLRVMKLDSREGKDACDYLRSGRSQEFTDLYWSASLYTPKGVLSADELWERLNTDRPEATGTYPWQPLNELTFGFRPTELVTICAGAGHHLRGLRSGQVVDPSRDHSPH